MEASCASIPGRPDRADRSAQRPVIMTDNVEEVVGVVVENRTDATRYSGGRERLVFFIDLHDDKQGMGWPTLAIGSNG